MIRQGIISTSAITPLRPATDIGLGHVEWPEDLEDFSGSLTQYTKEMVSSKSVADVWLCRMQGDSAPNFLQVDERENLNLAQNEARLRRIVIKVPRLPGGLSTTGPKEDQFQQACKSLLAKPTNFLSTTFQILCATVKERFDLEHENLVDLIGLDRSYGRYPGIVLEYCPYGDLTHFKGLIIPYEENNQRYLREIGEGLQYLHNLPSALSHGDLTPDNIFVDGRGTLKLSIISFARIAASLPANTQIVARPDGSISARYSSPELLMDGAVPTPESDM
ncbi:unnamed protein product [Rhizoctonia solani]|uniref:non-specific serine/threonine protein kinase n=1 Tax=Rhizoctonia solani TaxID=456999 RepID=A0A8H3DZ43_9AGAM|nr:unnamed protein product [Rhizoctonia solani]